MSESNNFIHYPFAALAQKLITDAVEERSAPAQPSVRKSAVAAPKVSTLSRHSHAEQNKDAEENQLFLQAVQHVRPQVRDKTPSPSNSRWRLEDTVGLPDMVKLGKKSKHVIPKAQPVPAQSRVAQCQTEHTATAPKARDPQNALRDMVDIACEDVSASADEQAFFRAMREVQPLAARGRDVIPEVEPAVNPEQVANLLQDFLDGKLEFALSLTGEYLEGYVVGLDEITMNRLRAGQYSPEAHLDLHGLNAVQAYQALVGFFRSAWYKGLRTVLVVPGRGRNSFDGIAVLRDKLQSWLTQEPFKRVVLAFCTARPVDGGPGSVYVLLRKYRKKGKIFWERTPADPDLF